MTLFFDASAIVAAYAQEAGSACVRSLLADNSVAVSRLTEVEVVSALARLERESCIMPDARDAAIAVFLVDLGTWNVVDFSSQVVARARSLLLCHSLRAGDAIQLASALVLESHLTVSLDAFVAADRRLIAAARLERLTVTEI